MAKRAHISIKTKLAAALLAVPDLGIEYEHAKQMTADQIISLVQFDHGVLHALGGTDEPWNLTPRLIAPHRAKSRRDTSAVAKVKRLDRRWAAFTSKMMSAMTKSQKTQSKWPSRPFKTRRKK